MRKFTYNSPLPTIFFTVFLDLLGFGILIPVIPLLLADPSSEYFLLPKEIPVSQGFILLGFLTAVFPIGQFFAAPVLGQLSDKYGRKKLLALSLAGTCLSYILFAVGIITRNIPLLFISRAFDGITGGNIAVAQAVIADITTPENRAKNFGLIGAAFGLGFIFGPYIGGKLSDPTVVSWFNASTPFWFTSILSALNVFFVLFLLPETHKTRNHVLRVHMFKSISNIIQAFSIKNLKLLFAVNFLFQGGFAFFTTFFSVFLINKFMFTQGNIGDFFAYVGIWIAFAQAFLVRRIHAKFTELQVLKISILGIGLFVLFYLVPSVWWQLLFIPPLFASFIGLTQANLTALISRSVDSSIQGEILGINASVQALAQSVPPILSGFIAASLTPEAPIVASSIVVMSSGLLFLLFYKSFRAVK